MASINPDQLTSMIQDLQSQLQQMQSQIDQQTTTAASQAPRSPTLKPAKPETFDGVKTSSRVDAWLFQLSEYFTACGVSNNEERVAYAGAMLRGAASTWWRQRRTLAAAGALPNIGNWQQFCSELRAQFTIINEVKVARDELARLKQTGAVQSYASKFREIILQIPGITEQEQLDRFIRGLKPKLQRELAIREPVTLGEAVRMAERIDVVDFAWQQRMSRSSFNDSNHQQPVPMELGAIESKPPSAMRRTSDMSHPRAIRPGLESKRQPLSDEDRQHLRKIGACFKCRQTGHNARNCPELRQYPNGRAQ
jgi:hypothetical protein